MSFETRGKIEVIYPEQQISEKFKKREFVIEIQDGMYPQFIKMQLTQDRCSLIDGFQVGDQINVTFDLKGRPFQKDGKTMYFTNVEAWRVSGADAPSAGSTPGDVPPPPPPVGGDVGGELPF
ncbi:DUF3127 domain-containing protein [Limibacter armeniacum]|uniref:DUF3127 domain-containing protein n=1 Tax=Limibacter armeniacum TaxID=466084 RepID=UPI002FE67750